MRYPHAPFTQKIRAALRKAISSHHQWLIYKRTHPNNVPHLNAMTREQIFETADNLGINVHEVISNSGAQTGQRYRTGASNLDFDKRTDAVIFLESNGYVYAGGKWQLKPKW